MNRKMMGFKMSCVEEKKKLETELRFVRTELNARNKQLSEAVWELKKVRDTRDMSSVADCLFIIGGIMVTRDDANLKLIEIAKSFVGVHEVGGDNKGPDVEAFQRAVDGKAQGEPWCCAFQMFNLIQTENQTGLRSQVYRSELVRHVWDFSPDDHKSSFPLLGSFICWRYGETQKGHIGLVIEVGANYVLTVEGNTGPGAGIEREGDGVYIKRRPLTDVGNMKLMGFLRVF